MHRELNVKTIEITRLLQEPKRPKDDHIFCFVVLVSVHFQFAYVLAIFRHCAFTDSGKTLLSKLLECGNLYGR